MANVAVDNDQFSADSEHPLKKISLTDATFLIGFASAAIYLWAYLWERGNKKYYDIPDMFIEVSTTMVVKNIGQTWVYLIILVGLTAIFLVFLEYYYGKDRKSTNKRKVLYIVETSLVLILVGTCMVISLRELSDSTVPLLVLIVVGYYCFLKIIFSTNKSANILEDVLALASEINDKKKVEIYKKERLKIRVQMSFVILFHSMFMFLCAFFLGGFDAEKEDQYVVIERPIISSGATQKYIVLDTYGLYFIIAPFNESDNTFKPDFELIEQKYVAQKPLSLSVRETGRIKPQEKKP